jgi:rod shape-determining protein MreC
VDSIGLNNKKTGPDWHLLVIFLAAAIICMSVFAAESENGPIHVIRKGVGTVSMPLQQAGSALARPFTALGNAITNASASTEDLTTLQDQNAELTAQVAQLEEYRQENERLTALLELQDVYNVEGVGARVIAQSNNSYSDLITIDKGADEGIASGMPVMSADGLIGQVDTVYQTSSSVRLLTDESSGVSVLLQNSRAEGVLSGSAEGLLYLEYIPKDVEVLVGDVVVTSGMGGVYPKGIVVGEVVDVTQEEGRSYQTIVVKSPASAENYEEVLVLTDISQIGQ